MLNYIWTFLIIFSAVSAFFTGNISELSAGIINGALEGIELAISLCGSICFWSGISQIMDKSGFSKVIEKILSPILLLIFPETERNSAAFSAIAMNVSANMLCLGNAATPLGLKAMNELKKISTETDGNASYAMMKFVLMNTASIQLIPTTAAAIRAAEGSENPFDITFTVWIVSVTALAAGLAVLKITAGKKKKQKKKLKLNAFIPIVFSAGIKLIPLTALEYMGNAALPLFLLCVMTVAVIKKIHVFDEFINGAKKGIKTTFTLLPTLCGLVTAITAARASGLIDIITKLLSPAAEFAGIKSELMPLCIIRPFSGSGALSVYKSILTEYGADSAIGKTAAVISGASETTFYALSVYFGSTNTKAPYQTVLAAVAADTVCFITASRLIR